MFSWMFFFSHKTDFVQSFFCIAFIASGRFFFNYKFFRFVIIGVTLPNWRGQNKFVMVYNALTIKTQNRESSTTQKQQVENKQKKSQKCMFVYIEVQHYTRYKPTVYLNAPLLRVKCPQEVIPDHPQGGCRTTAQGGHHLNTGFSSSSVLVMVSLKFNRFILNINYHKGTECPCANCPEHTKIYIT